MTARNEVVDVQLLGLTPVQLGLGMPNVLAQSHLAVANISKKQNRGSNEGFSGRIVSRDQFLINERLEISGKPDGHRSTFKSESRGSTLTI